MKNHKKMSHQKTYTFHVNHVHTSDNGHLVKETQILYRVTQ